MVMMKPYRKLKFILLSSVILFSLYAFHPFINGLGCDFQAEIKEDDRVHYTTCHMGLAKTVVYNKKSNIIISFLGLYGKSGDDIFYFVINQDLVEKSGENKDYLQFYLVDNKRFFIAKKMQSKNEDIVLLKVPDYQVFLVKRVGRLGWW